MEFELKLQSGKTVVWEGKDWEDAARRYVGMHATEAVVAWRHYPRFGVFSVHPSQIKDWGE